jgi:hypothetical protein
MSLFLLVFFCVFAPVEGRARLVVVFPMRSTAELSMQAAEISREVVTQLGNVDGYDARLVKAPDTGTLGAAAAAEGAETYVVGQVLEGEGGLKVTIGLFSSATDGPLAEYHALLSPQKTLPLQPSVAALLGKQERPVVGAPPVSEDGTLVPTGLPVSLTVDAPISSSSAKVGDTFSFKSTAPLVVNGLVVIQKGAQGQGEVTLAEHSGGNGHPGKLGLQFDWIAGIDGNKIALSNTPRSADGEEKKGASSTATIASYLVLGPLGLFAHNFVHGRDVTIDDSTIMRAYVDHSVHVLSQTQEVVPAGFAK